MAPSLTLNGPWFDTGGTWFDGVVATAIGTCDSAWHFKHSPEVSVAVVNFRSATATCSGAMAGCVWQGGQSIPGGPGAPVGQPVQEIAPGACTAGTPSAWTSVWVMGNKG